MYRTLLLLLLVGCAKKPLGAIPKPPLDHRDYRLVDLDNGLRAFLIRDPTTTSAAVSLDVAVGHFADPPGREGLAHFLEHALTLGSERYPGVDDYGGFINAHGGFVSASTAQERTSYQFSIEAGELEGALDRLAGMLISPLLDPAYVERTREVVHAEYTAKLQDWQRRLREVRRRTSNPAHGFAKFSVGDRDTLADREGQPVSEDLRSFFEREYSADRMSLTLFGPQELDVLEAWARERFSDLPRNDLPPVRSVPIYLEEQVGVRIDLDPGMRYLQLVFPIPPRGRDRVEHSLRLLLDLLERDGPGSPKTLLEERGWSTNLWTSQTGSRDHRLVHIMVVPTDEGAEHLDEIVGLLFQYIRLLREVDDLSPWWDEFRRIRELKYRFSEPPRPFTAVSKASDNLHLYPSEHVLDASVTFSDDDVARVRSYLDALVPSRLRMLVADGGRALREFEPRYQVPYEMAPLDPRQIALWMSAEVDPALRLPEPNPFIAEDTRVKAARSRTPRQLVDEPALQVSHLQSVAFELPKATVSTVFVLPRATGSMEDRIRAGLLADLVEDSLGNMRRQLSEAGLSNSLVASREGLELSIHGFDDKQAVVLDAYMDALRTYSVDPERFERFRDQHWSSWATRSSKSVSYHVGWPVDQALETAELRPSEVVPYLDQLTPDDLQDWLDELFDEVSVEFRVHGNHTPAETLAMARSVSSRFADTPGSTPPPITIRRIPDGQTLLQDVVVDQPDSAIRVLWQARATDLTTTAAWELLVGLTKRPAFTQLRTEEKLGYIVVMQRDWQEHVPGLTVLIQSHDTPPTRLLERIDAFMTSHLQRLQTMEDAEFERVKRTLVDRLRAPPANHREEGGRFLFEFRRHGRIHGLEALAGRIEALTRQEVVDLMREEIVEHPSRLVVRGWSTAHGEPEFGGCADTDCVVAQMPKVFIRPH